MLGRYVSRNTRVWCNPPYSRGMVAQFVEAFCHTRFCFLVRSDTSTDWWAALWPYVAVEARPKERINFEPPPGVEEPPGNPYPHSLLYANAIDVTATVIETCYVTTVQHQRRLKT